MSTLRLSLHERVVFAVIFNFWVHTGEQPVRASYTTIRQITGVSRPRISKALKALVNKELIKLEDTKGRDNYYSVTLPQKMVNEFELTYMGSRPSRPELPENRQQFTGSTTTSSQGVPQNKANLKNNTNKNRNSFLSEEKVSTGGLPEA